MAKEKMLTASWNKEYVKSKSREEFIEAHAHLGDAEVIGAEYDKIVPPTVKLTKEDKK